MNLELVEKIVGLLGEYPVSEIAVEQDGSRIFVRKPLQSASASSAPAAGTKEALAEQEAAEPRVEGSAAEAEARVLTAPMVGIFYHTEPPLSLGAEIKAGQVIGSIESMKLMNDVAAEASGRVTDILVEDGAPVDYGRALFRLAAE